MSRGDLPARFSPRSVLRRRLENLEQRITTGNARLLMPDGSDRILPGDGAYSLRLYCYAGRMLYDAVAAEKRNTKYEKHLAWIRSAVEVHEPEGGGFGGTVADLVAKTDRFGELLPDWRVV